MKCKQCGSPLTANTLDHCPKCNPKPTEPQFTKSGRIIELFTFLTINTLVILGVIFVILLILRAWFLD